MGLILCNITRQELAREAIANSVEKKKIRKEKDRKGKGRRSYSVWFDVLVILNACVLSSSLRVFIIRDG